MSAHGYWLVLDAYDRTQNQEQRFTEELVILLHVASTASRILRWTPGASSADNLLMASTSVSVAP